MYALCMHDGRGEGWEYHEGMMRGEEDEDAAKLGGGSEGCIGVHRRILRRGGDRFIGMLVLPFCLTR